jgi:hydroxymethylglutaryl-CoA reductase (NADPH)
LTLRPARPLSRRRLLSLRIDTVLSTWTRLVGDPVLSKGIVGVLVLSVLLNAYLIRGVGRARSGGVRFEEARGEKEAQAEAAQDTAAQREKEAQARREAEQDGWARDIASASATATASGVPETVTPMPISLVHAQTPAPTAGAVPTFSLEDVDARLRARGRSIRSQTPARRMAHAVRDESDDESEVEEAEQEPRSLPDLIALLESSPKSAGLRGMSDEEVVLLAQAGKVAGYALEKVRCRSVSWNRPDTENFRCLLRRRSPRGWRGPSGCGGC